MAQDRRRARAAASFHREAFKVHLEIVVLHEKSPRAQILQNPIIKIFATARSLLNHQVRTAAVFPPSRAWASFATGGLALRCLATAGPGKSPSRHPGWEGSRGRPGGNRTVGLTLPRSAEAGPGRHPDMLASSGAPWGVLLLVFGSEKAWRNAKPINDGPPGLCRSRNSWFHFHGLAADVLAQPDIFMVEFLVEKTGYVFSRKVEFLLFTGPQQLCFATVRGLTWCGVSDNLL